MRYVPGGALITEAKTYGGTGGTEYFDLCSIRHSLYNNAKNHSCSSPAIPVTKYTECLVTDTSHHYPSNEARPP